MKSYVIQLIWQALALVLGFVLTSITGYLAKHHVKVKIAGQEVDTSKAIQDLINQAAKWGVASAAKEDQWSNEQKKVYVRNLVINFLEHAPIPVKNAATYTPVIDAAIESALAGYKLAQDRVSTATKEVNAPTPIAITEPVESAQNANNDSLATSGQTDSQEQSVPKVNE